MVIATLNNVSKAQNAAFFASALQPTTASHNVSAGGTVTAQRTATVFRVYLISSLALTNAELQVTWDGTNWFNVSGVTPAANTLVQFDIPVSSDSLVNFRHTNVTARNITCWVF